MPLLRAEAGSRPAGESLSFASPKERNQRKGDPTVCVPCADATGQPAVLGFGGVSLNSRRCASLRHTRALIRQTLRSSAHPEGQRGQNIHTGHRCARPRIAGASATRHALRSLGRAQQWPEWMSGCSVVWMFGCPPPAGCACGGAVAGWHARRSARASCSDSPWLSERRAQRKASSTAHPATDTTQVCPVAKRRGRRLGVAFLLGTFLWRSKEKYLARRGDSRPPPSRKARHPISAQESTLQNQ